MHSVYMEHNTDCTVTVGHVMGTAELAWVSPTICFLRDRTHGPQDGADSHENKELRYSHPLKATLNWNVSSEIPVSSHPPESTSLPCPYTSMKNSYYFMLCNEIQGPVADSHGGGGGKGWEAYKNHVLKFNLHVHNTAIFDFLPLNNNFMSAVLLHFAPDATKSVANLTANN
jgi:hypothetical protein